MSQPRQGKRKEGAMGFILAVTRLELVDSDGHVIASSSMQPGMARIRVVTELLPADGEDDALGPIEWNGDRGDLPQILDGDRTLETRFDIGAHTLGATGPGGGASITVRVWRLDVAIVDGQHLTIADDASMATVTAQARVLGPAEVSFNAWTCSVSFSGADDCSAVPSFGVINSDVIATQAGGDTFTVVFSKVRGRNLSMALRYTADGEEQETATFASIVGINPSREAVRAELPHDTLRRIACKESGVRQFDAAPDGGSARCPLYSADRQGRVGIMQVPDPTADEIWSWKANVARGVAIFAERVRQAAEYPAGVRTSAAFQALVSRFNERRVLAGHPPIDLTVPDFATGDFDGNLLERELDAIRGYDGWFGTDRFGLPLHEFRVAMDAIDGEAVLRVVDIDEQAREGRVVWERVPDQERPTDAGAPGYVRDVLSRTPACLQVPQPAPNPTLQGPAQLVRATRARYEVIDPPLGAVISNWKFTGGGVVVQRAAGVNNMSWEGTIVQGGRVSVDVTVSGAVQSLWLDVVVTARQWTENAPPVPLGRTGQGPLASDPRKNEDLGKSNTMHQFLGRSKSVIDGPNDGFNYLSDPPVSWTPQTFSCPALYDSTHPFFRAHDAATRGAPLPSNRLDIGQLQVNVEAHEGIIAPPPKAKGYASHWQKLLKHLLQPQNLINIPLEADVSHASREASAAYHARLQRQISARMTAAENASTAHPKDIFPGDRYFNYPLIYPRSVNLQAGGAAVHLALSNPRGGHVRWKSAGPAIATVHVAAGTVSVAPVAAGATVIRVVNADGEADEIAVTVV
jgi:hypothetical protein